MYVIAQPKGAKKAQLFQAKRQTNGQITGIVPDFTKYETGESAAVITILSGREVLLNLGDDPPIGSVYGVWVEPIAERLLVKGWGEIFSHIHKMHDSVKTRITRAFPAAMTRVKRLGPPCDWDMRTEIRNPKGLIAGTYAYQPKGIDVLTLRPQQGQDVRTMVKVIAHELAHGVWFRYIDASQRAKWILFYERYCKVQEVSVRDIRMMLKDVRQIESIKAYLKDAEPEDGKAAEMYLSWLKKVHNLDVRGVQDLITSGNDVPIPDTHIHKSEVEVPITLYSKTNASELFAEAMSSFIVGDLNNRNIEKMLKELA